MNRCDKYMENLSLYIDGELSAEQAGIIEEHLKECDSCANELAIMKAIISACSELEEELPEGFEASLHKRLEKAKEEDQARRKTVGKIRMFSQIAAGFVIVLTLGLAIRSGIFNPTNAARNKLAYDMAVPQSVTEARSAAGAEFNEETMMSFNVALKSAPKESPERTGETGGAGSADYGISGIPDEKIGISDVNETEKLASITFGETQFYGSFIKAGQDTVVRIRTDDIDKAFKTIAAIDKKLDSSDWNDIPAITGTLYAADIKTPVELKLFYPDDKKWQEFLGEMQTVFPGMEVESAPASEEQEYIRIVIEIVK